MHNSLFVTDFSRQWNSLLRLRIGGATPPLTYLHSWHGSKLSRGKLSLLPVKFDAHDPEMLASFLQHIRITTLPWKSSK